MGVITIIFNSVSRKRKQNITLDKIWCNNKKRIALKNGKQFQKMPSVFKSRKTAKADLVVW